MDPAQKKANVFVIFVVALVVVAILVSVGVSLWEQAYQKGYSDRIEHDRVLLPVFRDEVRKAAFEEMAELQGSKDLCSNPAYAETMYRVREFVTFFEQQRKRAKEESSIAKRGG
jgi:flagellar basal body-associated protein FliL